MHLTMDSLSKEWVRLDEPEKTSLSDAVTDWIISQIRKGQYRAGDRLPTESELAEQLGVGRTSVREGLRFLEKLGILEVRQGTGTVVRSLSLGKVFEHPVPGQTSIDLPDRDVRDIMHVRRILGAESVQLAARHATQGQLTRLEELLDGMAASLENPRDYLEMDLEFHVVVAKASPNAVLAQLINLIRDIYTRYFEIVLRDPEMNKTSLDFHPDSTLPSATTMPTPPANTSSHTLVRPRGTCRGCSTTLTRTSRLPRPRNLPPLLPREQSKPQKARQTARTARARPGVARKKRR
jgi:DNA-binding FadR family transcriptional regulator